MRRNTVRTSRLEVEYLEDGPRDGPAVLLLHGFPDAATSWTAVMEGLAAEGRRAVAPFIRGCGGTRFLSPEIPRAGDFAALGRDAVELVDALELAELTVVGQDWGSPTAEIVAMERTDLVGRLVKLNWYGVYTMAEMARATGFNYSQMRALWYVWMLNVRLGEMVLQYDRAGLARALWEEWSPSWDPEARNRALDTALPSFEGDDWLRVALSAYRSGIGDAETDPADEELRGRLKEPAPVACQTVILTGRDDGVERSPLDAAAIERHFGKRARVTSLPGVGHFPQREAPEEVVRAIVG